MLCEMVVGGLSGDNADTDSKSSALLHHGAVCDPPPIRIRAAGARSEHRAHRLSAVCRLLACRIEGREGSRRNPHTDPRIYHAGLAPVGPRAHQGAHRPSPAGAQADEVLESALDVL